MFKHYFCKAVTAYRARERLRSQMFKHYFCKAVTASILYLLQPMPAWHYKVP
jgi:hypothetical protein